MLYIVFMTKIASNSKRKVYSFCKEHLVWCPKYRRQVVTEDAAERLQPIIVEVCQQHQAEVLRLQIRPDHVPVLVECDPQFGMHRLVHLVKARSSQLLRQEFAVLKRKRPALWTNSYVVSTVGDASLAVMKQSIENQKHV
jgi:putative transposase